MDFKILPKDEYVILPQFVVSGSKGKGCAKEGVKSMKLQVSAPFIVQVYFRRYSGVIFLLYLLN